MKSAERDLERDIARSLVGALARSLAPDVRPGDLRAARDAAQLLGLPGLDRLVAALSPHAGQPWPAEIQPVVERLQRVSARAAAAGGISEFSRADADFHALAGEIVAMEWSTLPTHAGVAGPSVSTLSAAEMLSDLSLAGDESASVARRVRLTMRVAAAVRAALDWLAGHEGVRQPLELREDASVLEIACEMRDAAGVKPAHEVISGVGGNLGPPPAATEAGGVGSWTLRVPAFSARPTYVMLEQGPLRLAVPWHAVLRLQIVRRDAIESRAARLGVTVLPPLAPLSGRGTECPVLIVAHGLKRAWMVADRLVWRLPADACEAGVSGREAGLTRAVSTDDGEVFALAEPRLLLAGVPMPPFPRIADAAFAKAPLVATPARPEVLDERWVTPLPAPGAAEVEGAGEAEPLGRDAHPPAAEPRAGRSQEADPEGHGVEAPRAPAPVEGGARRALVAEDSITARIFLTRMLEQQGFEVVAVDRAAELNTALAGGAWSLVCVDVELPDARGTGLLRSVRDRLPEGTPLVALARDDQDVAAARVAGVWRTLLKPVEPGALRRLLARVGLAERASG